MLVCVRACLLVLDHMYDCARARVQLPCDEHEHLVNGRGP